jgi:hypothetical protein
MAFVAFAVAEPIRYPYYLLKTIEMENTPLGIFFGNLRYNAFIIFYPLGAYGDLMTGVYSGNTIKKLGYYSIMMPNSFNFQFDYSWFITYFVPVLYIIMFPINYKHLLI